jgi:TBC1 domain family member 2B
MLLQGMNRLAAILLLFLSEEDAFWGLIAIIETLLPRQYYDRTLIAAHADQVCTFCNFKYGLNK